MSVSSTYLVFGMYVGAEADQWLDAVCVAIVNRQMQWGVPVLPNAICECVYASDSNFTPSFCTHCVLVSLTYLVFGIYVGPEGDQWLDAVCVALQNRPMQWGVPTLPNAMCECVCK